MKSSLRALILATGLAGALCPPAGWAAEARIWLSDCLADPAPEALTLASVVNTPRMLHIWARPTTDDVNMNYNTLLNFSLDLLAQNPMVDILDTDFSPNRPITVYNPAVGGSAGRFQFVNDSTSEFEGNPDPLLSRVNGGGPNDRIRGLGGFTIDSADYNGIGPACDPADRFCGSDGADDAWLLASVWYTPLAVGDTVLNLQIGANGISHMGDPDSEATDVIFGTDAISHNAKKNRQETLDANAEATITGVPAATMNTWTGTGDDWATTAVWSEGTFAAAVHDAVLMPAGGETLMVTGCQRANHTQIDGGRLHIASGAALASEVTVAAAGAISGGGWISADLINNAGGTHVIDASETLKVAGTANVTNAQLAIAENYSQPAGTITAPFDILQAASLVGTYDATANSTYFGRGIFLAAISHNEGAVSVQLRNLPGDYNGDGAVDDGDYMAWKKAFGQTGDFESADGNLDGVVGAADYVLWRNHVGLAAVPLGSGTAAAVPEPTAACLLLAAAAGSLLWQRGRPQPVISSPQ